MPFAPSATEVSRSVSECVYGWTAAYQQRGPNISVRIELNKDANVTDSICLGTPTSMPTPLAPIAALGKMVTLYASSS